MKLKIGMSAVLALSAFASGALAAGNVYLSPDEMKKATQIYFDRCAGCHGMLRKGALGPNLLPKKTKQMGTETLEYIIYNGTPGGMPDWGASGELTKKETELMAKFIQLPPVSPPEKSMADMKKTWKVLVPPEKRPTKPETKRNWENYFGIVLRDVGKVAIVDGDTKELVSIVPSGFATHILRTSKSGRYMYAIGRDGKASVIDLWMKKPQNVAEIRVCNDARSIDTSKAKGYEDEYAVVGCYWPPSIVTLKGDTLEPIQIVSTASYTYDTGEFTREARVASIVANHHKPEWVINVKETGQVWLYNYSDPRDPKIHMLMAERYLHDGGWDLTKRYFLVAANARNKVVAVDTKDGEVAAIIPTGGTKPHPGRGANVSHPKYGPIWCTGHIGSNDVVCIGTDPTYHPQYAWRVVKDIHLPGEGGGNLFIKTHPACKYIIADRPVNPDRKLQTQLYVIDKNKLKVVKTIKIPRKYVKERTVTVNGKKIKVKPRGPVHIEFNKDGDEFWVSVWGNKLVPSAILVYDAEKLKLKKAITGDWVRTPTGKFNVFNTKYDIY
ncbi:MULTISPECIES: nitrite reductase [unclassified Nitratiruptor]|uniref:nitrite reductase n=1 Tax=unclassified Nitratiruptor TaxID=2624044 RepID=UPI001915682F|nr:MULTISPECIES: nitrite reductase [unclassified Nitratiruptor]BCD61072.1 nitrite reductase (NO-forming) / hydroxylamine reductase [Nitratiruptor sp. YY08-10]BCD65005.1 nitrite reductase (NO-forming) / hydroxylamine reductase [Nitratiruptor sp. YY08-14]